MPRLVLYADDGRQLFEGDVSEQNVHLVATFLRKHRRTFEGIAAVKRAINEVFGGLQGLQQIAARPRPRRRTR